MRIIYSQGKECITMLYYKIKKKNGFISIETIIIAGICIMAGYICFNTFFNDTYTNMLLNIKIGITNYIL